MKNYLQPRDWQNEALELVDQIQDNIPTIVTAPCGAGKAYLLMFLIQSAIMKGCRVLLLVDRTKLIKQLATDATFFGFDFNLFVGKNKDFNKSKLLTLSSPQTFFKSELQHDTSLFNFILVDECHTQYTALSEYIKSNQATIQTIGVTATPYTQGLREVYPNVINTITAAELVNENILVPIKPYEFKPIDMQNAKVVANEWVASEIEKRSAQIYGDVAEYLVKFGAGEKTIIFGANLKHCEAIKERLSNVGIGSAVYHSQMALNERESTLKEFEHGDNDIIISVSALSKGFDCKKINLILDLRPLRTSLSEYIQMLGRGVRSYTGKTHCTLIDFSGNWARFGQYVELLHYQGAKAFFEHDIEYIISGKKERDENQKKLDYKKRITKISQQYLATNIERKRFIELTEGVELTEHALLDILSQVKKEYLEAYKAELDKKLEIIKHKSPVKSKKLSFWQRIFG